MPLSIQLVSERLLISHGVNVFIEISWVVCSLTTLNAFDFGLN